MWTFKAAIERGGFTRAAINTAIETKLKGFVTPGGKLRFGRANHTGLNVDSMWAGPITNCKPKPVFGAAFGVIK